MAGAPVEEYFGELLMAFSMQQQDISETVPLDPQSGRGPGRKLVTCRYWFSRPAHQGCPDKWDALMSTAKLWRTFKVYHGAHLLTIEEGCHLHLPCHRRVCRLCHTRALGGKRHMPRLMGLQGCLCPTYIHKSKSLKWQLPEMQLESLWVSNEELPICCKWQLHTILQKTRLFTRACYQMAEQSNPS